MVGQAQTRKRKTRSEFGGGHPNIVEVLNVLEKTEALPSAALGAPPKYVRILPTPMQDVQIVQTQPTTTITSQNSNQSSAPSRTTEWHHKKREMEEAEGKPTKREYIRTIEFNLCKKCGQPRITLNGHRQYRGVVYCPSFEKLSKDVWLLQMKNQKEIVWPKNFTFQIKIFSVVLACLI